MLNRPLGFTSRITPQGQSARHAIFDPKAIIVALDGGHAAEKALPHAVALARKWHSPIHIVQVVSPIQRWNDTDLGLYANTEFLSIREQSESYLEGVIEAIARSSSFPVTGEISANLSVDNALSCVCSGGGRLLAMAKPARSSFSQYSFGSVTNNLVGRLPIPLLLVPVLPTDDDLMEPSCQRILVCAGHGEVAESLLVRVAEFAGDDAACHLVHVFPLRAEWTTTRAAHLLPVNLRHDAAVRLHRATSWLQRQKVIATFHLVDDWRHSPADAILAQADLLSADLIIVGMRRHVVPWWLRGGVSNYITRRSRRPVLLVPEEESVSPLWRGNHVDFNSN